MAEHIHWASSSISLFLGIFGICKNKLIDDDEAHYLAIFFVNEIFFVPCFFLDQSYMDRAPFFVALLS